MDGLTLNRDGTIRVIEVTGEFDFSNVDSLDEALRDALSDETASCVVDLSRATFIDSSVVHGLIRWSKEAQLSEREALAIMIGGHDTPAAKTLMAAGVLTRLPVFGEMEGAKEALRQGQQPRPARSLAWLTDLELSAARDSAQTAADHANQRLADLTGEQRIRREEAE